MNIDAIVAEFKEVVKDFSRKVENVSEPGRLADAEKALRSEGRQILCKVFGGSIQQTLDSRRQQLRQCPQCGARRRHKGRRSRQLTSSFGAVSLEGIYWQCPRCKQGSNSVDHLLSETFSPAMEEFLCFLGTSMGSFASASICSDKLLGVRVSDNTIRKLCIEQGQRAVHNHPSPPAVKPGQTLVGSCDGTMINTRQDGWRELKALQFRHDNGRYCRAFLENSKNFGRRLREAALRMGVAGAGRFSFVSDAAGWIEKSVRQQLPWAVHTVDIWHACEHIWWAGNCIHGEGSDKARNWSEKYCRLLHQQGARALLSRLVRIRYKDPGRQASLEKLKSFLSKHKDRMRYKEYVAEGLPISSGPMESFCKQLGQRLKGPGMRWSKSSVNPMAAMVSLLCSRQWNAYWKAA